MLIGDLANCTFRSSRISLPTSHKKKTRSNDGKQVNSRASHYAINSRHPLPYLLVNRCIVRSGVAAMKCAFYKSQKNKRTGNQVLGSFIAKRWRFHRFVSINYEFAGINREGKMQFQQMCMQNFPFNILASITLIANGKPSESKSSVNIKKKKTLYVKRPAIK